MLQVASTVECPGIFVRRSISLSLDTGIKQITCTYTSRCQVCVTSNMYIYVLMMYLVLLYTWYSVYLVYIYIYMYEYPGKCETQRDSRDNRVDRRSSKRRASKHFSDSPTSTASKQWAASNEEVKMCRSVQQIRRSTVEPKRLRISTPKLFFSSSGTLPAGFSQFSSRYCSAHGMLEIATSLL